MSFFPRASFYMLLTLHLEDGMILDGSMWEWLSMFYSVLPFSSWIHLDTVFVSLLALWQMPKINKVREEGLFTQGFRECGPWCMATLLWTCGDAVSHKDHTVEQSSSHHGSGKEKDRRGLRIPTSPKNTLPVTWVSSSGLNLLNSPPPLTSWGLSLWHTSLWGTRVIKPNTCTVSFPAQMWIPKRVLGSR